MELANRVKKVSPSATLAITSKAKRLKSEGKDIVNFGAGEPDFDTPEFIKNVAVESIKSGFTKYTPSTGIPELKKCISQKFKRDNSLDYPPEQIAVSCGAKHSIFNTIFSLLNPGDEVIIPLPYWVSYPQMVRLCGGEVKFIPTKQTGGFKIKATDLRKSIGRRSKLLILNSPSNPCGSLYSKQELQAVAEICTKHSLYVISDEIYEKIIFDDNIHTSLASINKEIFDLTVTVNGISKAYSMTGWRIGYIGGPEDVIKGVAKIQDHSSSNPNSIAQKAAIAAISSCEDFSSTMCNEFQKRRDYIISRLDKMKKITYFKPQGAFYVFCNISKTKLTSLEFSSRLLEEELVAVIPGIGFGLDEYVRISFATSLSEIKKGMDRIEQWEKQL